MIDKNKPNLLFTRLVLLIILFSLTACAGQQAALNMMGVELKQLSEYQQLMDAKRASEAAYYKKTRKNLTTNLKVAQEGLIVVDFVDRKSIVTEAQWENKKRITELLLLKFIDSISEEYEASQTAFSRYEVAITENYLNAVEKIENQRAKLLLVQNSLNKVHMEKTNKEKAEFIFSFSRGVNDELGKEKSSSEQP